MIGVIMPAVDVKGIVEEMQERVVEELDYELEAGAQSLFALEFADDPEIVVPEVVHNTGQVLVSTWLESKHSLAEIITNGTPEERDRYGEAYVKFLFAGPARTGMLHADPHPGNFRIMPDGRLGVVDYGAVARLPGGLPVEVGSVLRDAVDGDYDAVRDQLRELGFLRGGVDLTAEEIERYIGPFVEPASAETFTFSRDWMRRQMARISAPNAEGMGTALKINIPRQFVLMHRTWAGGIGVLSQLGATAHFRAILEENLPGFSR
jgi:predicted unusual protein kinase regulating ubiquinone biosynthesis (AarF/ABC1/UbiB family)